MIAFANDLRDSYEYFLSEVKSSFAPRPLLPTWEWVCANGRTHEAQPFDATQMPWAKGVCEAWDNPAVREIVMMWGTRLGKTMVSLQLVAKAFATDPKNGIFATSTETLAKRTANEKLYKVLAAIEQTRNLLLPEHLRKISEIRISDCTWPVVWSGSDSMLADWGAHYGWGNEVSKWVDKKTADGVGKQGDKLLQFLERFKDYWQTRKVLLESSPGLKGKCKIESKFLESNQCRYHVPCPHCKKHQSLKMGNGDGTGGIVFDKTPSGAMDSELAQRTAAYECEKCRKLIKDDDRWWMMRCGKWVPKGCHIDKKGKLCGKPERTCEIWGGQLSSLYSLQLRWGDIARKFVECLKNPTQLQVFKNDWLAETWEPFYIKTEPEQVAERLETADAVGIMPAWSTWLFSAVDVQAEYFKWIKVACGPGGRVAIVARNACDTWDEVYDQCVNDATPHADGGAKLMPCLTLIDSGDGHKTDEVYRKCKEWSRPNRLVLPCKGDNTDSGVSYVKKSVVPETHKSKTMKRQALRAQGAIYLRINPFWHEPIINRWLSERKPGEPDSLSIPAELCDDEDFIHDLCNGVQSGNPSKMQPYRMLWVQRWPNDPNDYRDGLKYCSAAIDAKFRGNWRVAEGRQPANTAAPVPRPREPEPPGGEQTGRGRRLTRDRTRARRERMARR